MSIINYILYRVSGRLPCRLIHLDSGPYLERYYVGQLFGVTFYLHRFVSSDTERHLHNHPWRWGRSLVLSGGYDEEVVIDIMPAQESGCLTEFRKVRWWNRVDGNHFHRIANAEPGTWTLFFHGQRVRVNKGMVSIPKGWGFLERAYVIGYHDAVIFRPYPMTSGGWWETAPRGAVAGREPA